MIFRKLADKIEKTPVSYLFSVLFIVALAVFFLSLFNGFVWDDEEQILNNSFINNVSNIPYFFTSSTFNTGGAGLSGNYYKPLMPVSFSLIHAFAGSTSFFYHFFDLTIHFVNTILVFLFLKKFFGYFKYDFSKTVSFCLSFIFLVHPAIVESVAYVSSTQELLYVFFFLLTLLFSFRFLNENKFSIINFLLINLFLLCSLLSKESGIVAIPVVIFLALILNRKKYLPLLASGVFTFFIYLILRFPLAKTPILQHSDIVPIANASFFQRLLTIPYELFSYLRLTVFPLNLYVAQYVVIKNPLEQRFYLSLLALIFLSFVFVLLLKKMHSKSIIFFIIWVAFSLGLLLNIYPLDMSIAERWLYGPLIGILGIIGIIFLETIKIDKKFLNFFIAMFLILAPLFMIRSFVRTYDWNNNLSLFSHDIKYVSDSFDVQNNLGVALFRDGKPNEATKHFKESIRLSPNWWTAYNNLGAIYQEQGKIKEAKSLYEKSIETGNYYLAYENLAKLKYTTENPNETIKFINNALKYLPNNEILNKIGAMSFIKVGATESAKPLAEKAYLINPSQENYYLLQFTSR